MKRFEKMLKDLFRLLASLTKTQRRYCVTRRELLAVVVFVQHFKQYLLGRKFIIRTDHSALRWIMSFKEPENQMARWLEILSQYDFCVVHRQGIKHGNADFFPVRVSLPVVIATMGKQSCQIFHVPVALIV